MQIFLSHDLSMLAGSGWLGGLRVFFIGTSAWLQKTLPHPFFVEPSSATRRLLLPTVGQHQSKHHNFALTLFFWVIASVWKWYETLTTLIPLNCFSVWGSQGAGAYPSVKWGKMKERCVRWTGHQSIIQPQTNTILGSRTSWKPQHRPCCVFYSSSPRVIWINHQCLPQ